MTTIQSDHFTTALLRLLDETFDQVQGFYLDAGTSLFETLAHISAQEASVPVGGKCATLAAQVKHTAFFLDVVVKTVQDPTHPPVDWDEIWRTVSVVTAEEWQAIRDELGDSYNRVLELIRQAPAWPSEAEIAGAIAVVAHSAYHLGEIRQALCIIRS